MKKLPEIWNKHKEKMKDDVVFSAMLKDSGVGAYYFFKQGFEAYEKMLFKNVEGGQ